MAAVTAGASEQNSGPKRKRARGPCCLSCLGGRPAAGLAVSMMSWFEPRPHAGRESPAAAQAAVFLRLHSDAGALLGREPLPLRPAPRRMDSRAAHPLAALRGRASTVLGTEGLTPGPEHQEAQASREKTFRIPTSS